MKLKFNLQVADLNFSIHAADPYKVLLDEGLSGFVTDSTNQDGWQIYAHPITNTPDIQAYALVYEAIQADGQTLWHIEANPGGHKLLHGKRAGRDP